MNCTGQGSGTRHFWVSRLPANVGFLTVPLQTAHVRRPFLRAMADTEANLLRHFPLLLPQNLEKTVYEGFISAQVPCGVVLSGKSLSLVAQVGRGVSGRLGERGGDWKAAPIFCACAVPGWRCRATQGGPGDLTLLGWWWEMQFCRSQPEFITQNSDICYCTHDFEIYKAPRAHY